MITNNTDEHENLRRMVVGCLLPGFAGIRVPDWLSRELSGGLAGVCLFGSNIDSALQLRELTNTIRELHPSAIITLDEEGGDVTRLYYKLGSPYPGNAVLGRLNDPSITFASAAAIGHELLRTGCNLNLAPAVDINSNPNNPVIGVRSFGDDPSLVAKHSSAWIRGIQSTGTAACAKHFPGHGDTAQDSHLALPTVEAPLSVLLERELDPFKAAIAARTATIMTSHIVVPALDPDNPATFSRIILQDLLRDHLGFEGVIITDALDMKGASGDIGIPTAAVRALAAGADLLCIGSETTGTDFNQIVAKIVESINTGELSFMRLADAQERVARIFDHLPKPTHPPEDAPDPSWITQAMSPKIDYDTIIATFRLNDTARRWLDRCSEPFELYQLATTANMAVGNVPWGPASLEDNSATPSLTGTTHDAADNSNLPSTRARMAFVGRNFHLDPQAIQRIHELRRQDLDLIVIEMGWPADDSVADVCTFGASRLLSSALSRLLTNGLPQRTA
ncbi:glycoside hydrolase family 3 N-terminal domain-containing protein [Pseudarthrobacter sp. PS3-L1]|uniref:glycoside hydrolase family 3 protein n=1 Tax=Pseudarthrobacter sp. PS3-L1 TaxID=3046207 RepID=UPI0024BBBA24|nr:glycoside hydrolase family 3 N-terminal domain-containing protein [Pseudarthrobacter sp. PS3-L1]MDJ0318955.1 glycoside hydrolase family 3 N-terminal domain-containing protein [Pseudarthrobacter sp. PS3-L1]